MLDKIEFIFDKNFSAEKRFLQKVESQDSRHNKRTLVKEEKLLKLKEKYPQIPQEYLLYLKNVGSGDFRECGYMIYSGPTTLDSLRLSEVYPLKERIIFFGDNFSGDMAGFNLDNNCSVDVLWSDSGEVYATGLSFRQFIREKMGMGRFGKDLFKM